MKSSRPQFLPSLLLSALLLLHLHTIRAVDSSLSFAPSVQPPASTGATDFIRTGCNSTLYPDLCYSSLSGYASTIRQDPAQLALVAISVTLSNARRMTTYVSNLSRQADYEADTRAAAALHDCFSNFGDAVEEINGSLKQMRQLKSSSRSSFRFQMSNVQTWMSAALTDEDTCTDGFEDVSDGPMKKDICDRVEYVKKLTSNALALVNRYAETGTN
ncbi:21 kDa protein-like [Melia azedarach]|uniref:21 kDa protein-like n=1 Tax=Melia azedarach TaxID=155640 RepID=A0ACC1XG07_MELAZ|nr:21 kDa protein-like [Melia azedarach]